MLRTRTRRLSRRLPALLPRIGRRVPRICHDADASMRAIPITYTTFRYECHSSFAGRRRIIRFTAVAMLELAPGAMIIHLFPSDTKCLLLRTDSAAWCESKVS
jgi:hypothetical protein